jgi:nucleoside-diphosphate-sugar epimerase
MKILIIGAGGMVGQKLVHKLLEPNFNAFSIDEICLFDLYLPKYRDTRIRRVIGTVENSEILKEFSSERFGLIFYLASIVSGEAEENFEKGWDVNLFSMWNFLSALKVEHLNSSRKYIPKVIFTSSIAVFGAPFPDKIDDEFLCSPQTSYGAQKASIEILLSDFSRKGFINGVSLRLPTICVRPGKPNKAASGFFSNIIREPLNGQKAFLPVDVSVRHWHASPRAAAGFLMHSALMDISLLENRISLNLPGVSCTVEEQIEALRSIAGQKVVDLIIFKKDQNIQKMVAGWPKNFSPKRALKLGFKAEKNFEEIINIHIADEMK